jgi:hypothetical protein
LFILRRQSGRLEFSEVVAHRPEFWNILETGSGHRVRSNAVSYGLLKDCDDLAYRKRLLSKARAGALAPAVECMLWHYAKGKPKETIEPGGNVDLDVVTSRERARQIAKDPTTEILNKEVGAGRYLSEMRATHGKTVQP